MTTKPKHDLATATVTIVNHSYRDKFFTPKVRAWLYGIVGAVVPLLVILGVIDGTVAGSVLAIAGSVLAVGTSSLALANISK